MKLTTNQAKNICRNYDLGNLQRVTANKMGYVNHNFLLETSKGKFMVQVFGFGFTNWKKGKVKLEFKVLDYLRKKKFPYNVPQPLKRLNGNYFLRMSGSALWVYPYIEGEIRKRKEWRLNEIKEVAKAMAIYHKTIKPLGNLGNKGYLDFWWVMEQYENLKGLKPKNKLDTLFVKNEDFFYNLLKKLEKMDYGKLTLPHSDLDDGNVLFTGKRLTGIIDFDNVEGGPLAKDIAIFMCRTGFWRKSGKGWLKIFLNAYKKFNSLSKEDIKLIVPCMIRENSIVFLWFYARMKKRRNRAYSHMKETIDVTKEIVEQYHFK